LLLESIPDEVTLGEYNSSSSEKEEMPIFTKDVIEHMKVAELGMYARNITLKWGKKVDYIRNFEKGQKHFTMRSM
jgi:hypothetical protein